MPKILITGSTGLVGTEASLFFLERGWTVLGLDNNQRKVFFGPGGDTSPNRELLAAASNAYQHHFIDIRNKVAVSEVLKEHRPDAILHAAGQPSHDLAAKIPEDDFSTNALGTLHLLEAARAWAPESPFIFLSTNKVYGDAPNQLPFVELETRFDFADASDLNGISESLSIDQCTHSLFGVSKASADLLVQEYGRYFGLPTCCLRAGCITGPLHAGVELHGFLNYLVRVAVSGGNYRIYGYKGKQVRDNIHSFDVSTFVEQFILNPKTAAVYNIGGGKQNTCSILEAFTSVEALTGVKTSLEYVDQSRIGDHRVYYSNLEKIQADFPTWRITKTLPDIFKEIVAACKDTHP